MGGRWIDYGVRRFLRMWDLAEKSNNPNGLQRHLLRSIEGALWFEDIRANLRALSAGDVGKALFQEKYTRRNAWDEIPKDKRVERYATGRSRATRAYRDRALAVKRTFARQNVCVLIEALDVSRAVGDRANRLLRTTCPEIQAAIFKRSVGPMRNTSLRVRRRLARYACTESVAALVILLREAVEQGDTEAAFCLGEDLYYMTLSWCIRWPTYCSYREIGFYLCRYIFPLVRDSRVVMAVDTFEYFDCVNCLHEYVFQWNYFPREMRMAVLDDLFEGWQVIWDPSAYGAVYRMGLAPHLHLLDPEHADPCEWKQVAGRIILKTWGWRVLRLVERDTFPPEEVWALMKKDPQTLLQSDIDAIETEKELNPTYRSWMKSPLRRRQQNRPSDDAGAHRC